MRKTSLLWPAVLLAAGCFDTDRVPGGPPVGFENNERGCSDFRDNDSDGLVDCQDPDCIALNFCGEIIPDAPPGGFEGDVRTCTDRIDNDVDGQFDCGDRACQGIRELCCVTEFSDAACSNLIDDDGNGFADCSDFACRTNPFVTVCRRETICNDGRDNDGDRFEDCDDSDCALSPDCDGPTPGPENTFETCTDGFDNDGNGFSDCREFSCCDRDGRCISADIQEFCDNLPEENTTELCMNGIDDDGNGFFDCREFSCCDRDGMCISEELQDFCDNLVEENTEELCFNGIDDDEDGFPDCADFSCSEVFGARCEADFLSCTNGLDDEGDGFPDCSDFSCRDVVEMREFTRPDGTTTSFLASPCNESVSFPEDFVDNAARLRAIQQAIARCSDGIDGDIDGFVDCDDWDCQWNPLLNPLATADFTPALGPGFCQGGFFDPSLLGGLGGWRIPQVDDPEDLIQPVRPLLCR
ncbi:MAG: hypothetical protein AAGE52_04265 [Myxococcota bacterium]